ncbi:hypothetical protein NQ317_012505 [Molorchus minor]|uniref:Transmembrane protein 62 n=1 Tax=Molorchus minor TaxID=1323400 RepID=A0ABQ9K1H9_9CUCU|nr:hypothetical protein NQ317_012505 [Molorchus minor]
MWPLAHPRRYHSQYLELGDWKDNRMYRLLAIDHGLLSFTDLSHRSWPVVLVTNPKHALFVNPVRENIFNMRNSTHIRILAFSLSNIDLVKVKIDGGSWMRGEACLGSIVYAKDIEGRIKIETHPFSLDGTRLSFGILSRVALMFDASSIFRWMFFSMVILTTFPLCMVRYLHSLVASGRLVKPNLERNCCSAWLRKIWILSNIDRLFWPIVLYPIYLTFGPWTIGYLVEDHIGTIFAWGIFVNGVFLPGSFTYVYGFFQLLTFQVPLILIMSNVVDHRYQQIILKPGKRIPLRRKICLHLPFFIVFSMQLAMAYLFWLAYGTMAFLLGPLRTWSLILAGILYYEAYKLPNRCTRRVAEVWHIRSNVSINDNNVDLSPIDKVN